MTDDYPSMQTRYSAMIMDIAVMVLLMYFFATIFDGTEVSGQIRMASFIFTYLLFEPCCISFFGASIGHFLNGIRVKRYQQEQTNINIVQAIIRHILKFFLGIVSFVTISSNDQSRAIHDLVSGSVVVKK